jgi:hypothetical protein
MGIKPELDAVGSAGGKLTKSEGAFERPEQFPKEPAAPSPFKYGVREMKDFASPDMYTMTAHSPEGKLAGEYHVHEMPDANMVMHAKTDKDFRRQGVASGAYARIQEGSGLPMTPDTMLLPDGYKFWKDNYPEAVREHKWVGFRDANKVPGEGTRGYWQATDPRTGKAYEDLQQHFGPEIPAWRKSKGPGDGRLWSNPDDATMAIPAGAFTRPSGVMGEKDIGTRVPALVNGKTVSQWAPSDFQRFGDAFGTDLGVNSKPETVQLSSGRTVQVPRSFLENGQTPPSYYDQLALKAQGIDPNELTPELHKQIHNRMVAATDPTSYGMTVGTDPLRTYNGFLMGLSSPNNPLTPNQLAFTQTMAKSPADIRKMASMTPWKLSEASGIKGGPDSLRQTLSSRIAREFGLGSEETGGTGSVGSADWTRMSDFAKMMEQDPEFFGFRGRGNRSVLPNTPEEWEKMVSRVSSQVPGLSFKTGSFGAVWQNPLKANISAMDRHMAGKYRGDLFGGDVKSQKAWEKDVLSDFNKQYKLRGEAKVTSIDEMLDRPGGRGHYGERALSLLGRHNKSKLDMAKGGVNPNLPDYVHDTKWVDGARPDKVLTMSPAYRRALDVNARDALANDRGIFAEQWGVWDPIRQRLEPHENMNPLLQSIGRMNLSQIQEARAAHAKAGYFTSPAQVRPVENPASLALFSNPSNRGLGRLLAQSRLAGLPERAFKEE